VKQWRMTISYPDPSARRRRIQDARRRYQPKVPSPAVPAHLQAQWDEMHSCGVQPRGTTPPRVEGDLLHQLQTEPLMRVILEEVCRHLLPHVTNGLVAVADAEGRVLLAAGLDNARASAAEAGLTTGVVWTCLTGGLNGIGRTVQSRRGNQCFAETHWRAEQFELVCDVAPVWHQDRMIAAINITDRWTAANRHTLPMLQFFAHGVRQRLGQADRDGQTRQCAATQLLQRCDAPALVVYDNVVIAARDLPMRPGDRLEAPATTIGTRWHHQLGFVAFEPLALPNSWLVRSVSGKDWPRVVFDFSDPHDPVVRLRGTVVDGDHRVSRPQYRDILIALARNRAGLDAKALSRALYDGDSSRSRNIPPLLCRLREELWWLFPAKGYRLADEVDIELRLPPGGHEWISSRQTPA
jgi:hypothetical protein